MNGNLLLLLLMGMTVGASVTSQSGINAQLRTRLNSPIQAALISFFVGTVALAVISLLQGKQWPSLKALSSGPLWVWSGGVLGAFNITAAVILAPRLGALSLMMTVVAGQILTSLLLDHYGWLGYPRLPFSGYRFGGALLALIGLYLSSRR